MKNNIYLIIGDNATGKTRFLKNIVKCNNKKEVVTNMSRYKKNIDVDSDKIRSVEQLNNSLYRRIDGRKDLNDYEITIRNIFELISARGDILVLDELDAGLKNNDITAICAVISETRDNWEEIYITGYSSYLDRLFNNKTVHMYIPNYFMLDDCLQLKSISEETANAYFDTI